ERPLPMKIEKDQLLSAAGSARSPRKARAAGQSVDERGLADIRSSCEGDLGRAGRRQAVGAGGGEDEFARACKEFAPGLRPVLRCRGRRHTLGDFAWGFANIRKRLPQSSIFTPALVMM